MGLCALYMICGTLACCTNNGNTKDEEKWKEAELKYEQAYHLVPGKHGFAYKVGTSAHKAGDCERAKMYLDHFITYADAEKHADRLKSAKKLRGILGC